MVMTNEIIPRDPVTGEIDWPNEEARVRYERRQRQPVVTVTVSGAVASGKSSIAVAIENALVAEGIEVHFASDRYGAEPLGELIDQPRVELIERVDYSPPSSFFSERYKKYAAWPVVIWCRLRGHSGQPGWGGTNRCLRCGDAR
jgi:hypothetical protein